MEHFNLTADVLAFLEANADAHGAKLKVITNFYRENDGGDKAAELLVKALRNNANKKLKHVPVLVYCQDTAKASYLEDKKLVQVTAALAPVRAFCAGK